jgi:hypothetical protein
MAIYTGNPATNDVFVGNDGVDDYFYFSVGDLTGADILDGKGGTDRLYLTTAGTLAASSFAGVTAIERLYFANGVNDITLNNAMVESIAGDRLTVITNAGNDRLDGSQLTGNNSLNITAYTGDDELIGGSGGDTFRFQAADLTSADKVTGGNGSAIDKLVFGVGTVGAAAFANVRGIEQIELSNGTNSLTLHNAMAASATGGRVTVIGNAGRDTINASALSSAAVTMMSGAGNDVLTGGAGNDYFHFAIGDLTSADLVNGGGGTNRLYLTTAGTLAASAFSGVTLVERLYLANGTNNITLNDAMVESISADRLVVITSTGNDRIDGSQLTGNNSLNITAYTGNDELIGGTGGDTFRFDVASLDASDKVKGGNGAAVDTLALTGAGLVDLTGSNIGQIEKILLDDSVHNVVLGNAFVTSANGAAVALIGGLGQDSFNLNQVSTGTVTVTGGGQADALYASSAGTATISGTLGEGDDLLRIGVNGPGNIFAIDGGAGTNRIDIAVQTASSFTMDVGLTNFQTVNLVSSTGFGRFTFIANDTAGLFINATESDRLNTIHLGDGGQTVWGNLGNDIINGGDGDDTILSFGGDDWIDGGAGHDMIDAGRGNNIIINDHDDTIYGLYGTDTLVITDDWVVSTNIDHIEVIDGTNAKGAITVFYQSMADTILGSDYADSITYRGSGHVDAGNGDDKIFISNAGGQIAGGAGSDMFGIEHRPLSRGFYNIQDYETGVDKIGIKNGSFYGMIGADFIDRQSIVSSDDQLDGSADFIQFLASDLSGLYQIQNYVQQKGVMFDHAFATDGDSLYFIHGTDVYSIASGVNPLMSDFLFY